jgi:hypothetical protein
MAVGDGQEQSRATDQVHPSREWGLSLQFPEEALERTGEGSLPEALSDNKHSVHTTHTRRQEWLRELPQINFLNFARW